METIQACVKPAAAGQSRPALYRHHGWQNNRTPAERPAGRGTKVTITKDGWTSAPTEVIADPQPVRKGTILRFQDEPWESSMVDINAVFSGMQVTVDSKRCPKLPFESETATHHPKLGCRIEVLESGQLNQWHNACRREGWYGK